MANRCKKLLARISALWSVTHSEEGMLTVVQLVTVTFFAVLVLVSFSVITMLSSKMELQNAADASARAAVSWLARGMNALSASNHLVGETVAMLVVHDSIAGERPGVRIGDTGDADAKLRQTHDDLVANAKSSAQDEEAFQRVSQPVRAQATVLQAQKTT